jgi:hypothetical protein
MRRYLSAVLSLTFSVLSPTALYTQAALENPHNEACVDDVG